MKVTCHYRNDPERPLTDPVPELGGRRFIFRFYSGDVAFPLLGTLFGEKWFEEPFPRWVVRFFCSLPVLPFIAFKWPFLNRACCAGFKLFGVDSPAYAKWLCGSEDVFDGSQALCLTIRPFARIGE